MEGYSRNDEGCPQLLDLIPKDRERLTKSAEETIIHGNFSSEEKKLELSLGPPGGGDWTIIKERENNNSSRERNHDESLLSFGYFSANPRLQNPVLKPHHPWQQQQQQFLQQLQSQGHLTVMKESSQPCSNRAAELQSSTEKKAFSAANTAVPNSGSAQKRTAPAPVVGWPPIRSFRKNIASGSSKPASDNDSPHVDPTKVSGPNPAENGPRGQFVKINMDGIPIGRKVDLKAYDSYEKLSHAVDELFRGLRAAQSDICGGGIKVKEEAVGGLLNGSGEYTLVYEDNEGDRMLVGDVPWHMFVSTVRRLRVLKSSDLPKLSRGSKQGKPSCNA